GRKAASVGNDLIAMVWDVTGLLRDKPPPARATPERLAELWGALQGQDARKAGRAALALTASPEQTVELLAKQLRPVPPAAARLDRLVRALDSDQDQARQTAERELGRLGRAAERALLEALEGAPSVEQRRRIVRLLKALEAPRAEDVTASRAVEVLEW